MLAVPEGTDHAEVQDLQPAGGAVRSAYSGFAGCDANTDSSTDPPVWMTAMARQEATAILGTAGIEGGFVVRSSSNSASGEDDDNDDVGRSEGSLTAGSLAGLGTIHANLNGTVEMLSTPPLPTRPF